MHDVAAELKREGLVIMEVDYDAHREQAARRRIEALPTTIVYAGGMEHARIVGAASAAKIRAAADEAAGVALMAQAETAAGRHLIPYRNEVDGRLDGVQQQVNGLQSGRYLSPPGSSADTAGLSARVAHLEQRQAALEARQDNVRQTAEALAAKYESRLPGITSDVQRAIAESQAATTGLKEALDEDNPKGLFARVKARLEERLGGLFEVMPWLKYGLIGVAIGLGYLFLRKEGAKAAAGEQTAWQRVAALTPTEIDDRVAAKVAAGQAALHERLAGLQGTVSNLAGSVAAMAKDKIHPSPPTSGA